MPRSSDRPGVSDIDEAPVTMSKSKLFSPLDRLGVVDPVVARVDPQRRRFST
jgi:hypothetical protein